MKHLVSLTALLFWVAVMVAVNWTGATSINWDTASNWSSGTVPTLTTDVVIPSGTVRSPQVIWATGNCRDLILQSGATLTISGSYTLNVRNMTMFGSLIMSSSGPIVSTGNISWESGSTASIGSLNPRIDLQGNMTFQVGSNVQMAYGIIQFNGSASANLINYSSATQMNSLQVYKTYPSSLTISSATNQPFTLYSIYNFTGSTLINNYTGTVTLKGGLTDNNLSSDNGKIVFNFGTLLVDGANPSISLKNPNCYLQNITFSQTGTAQLAYPLTLKGNLLIESGVFYPQANTISIAGNWSNLVGPAAFTEGSARVIFNGTAHQYCNYTETFNIVEVNKSGGALRVNSSSAVVTCAQYDWTAGGIDVMLGTFTANDLVDSGIFGSYWVNPGGVINLTNNDSWVDLNGSMTFTNGGTINVYGGTGTSDWSYGGNASLTMNGPGILDFKNVGINIYNSSTYTLNCSVSDWDAEIRTVGSFSCNRSSFAPTDGRLVMYGATDATLTMNSGTLYNLLINKAATRDEETTPQPTFITDARSGTSREVTRANTVNLATNVTCAGYVSLDYGTLNLQSYQFNCVFVNISSTLKMNHASAKLFASYYIQWFANSIADITLGTLETTGSWYAWGNASVILPAAVETRLVGTGSEYIDIDTPNMQFGNLVVGSASAGAGYTMPSSSTYDLFVAGNLTITAGNELDMGSRNLTVNGALNLNGKLDIHATTVAVQGKPIFATTSNLSIVDGSFTFYDSSIPRDTTLRGVLNLENSTFNAVNNALIVNAGSTNTVLGSSEIICDAINAINAGTFQPVAGTVKLNSNLSAANNTINVSNGNWLPNVIIETNTGFALASNLIIKGDLTIQAGILDVSASNYSITISGNWQNQVGINAFVERSGRVIFNGSGNHQQCNYSETFSILEINKLGGYFWMNSPSTVVTCASYDWSAGGMSISQGTFTANDLTDNGIMGTFVVINNAIINLTNNDGYVDLNGDINISGEGTLNVYGGTTTSDWSYGGNAALTMSGGTLDFKNRGIRIYNSPSYTFTSNINGGTIRTVGGLEVNRAGFNPVGGTLELYGSTDASLIMSYGNLYNLFINKAATREEENQAQAPHFALDKDGAIRELTRSNTISLGSNIDVNSDLAILSGVLNASMLSINVGGNWYNSVGDAGFLEGQSTVIFDGSTTQYIYSGEKFYNLTLAKTGTPTELVQAEGTDVYVANDMNLVSGYYRTNLHSGYNYVNNLLIQSMAGFRPLGTLYLSGNMYDYNTTYGGSVGFIQSGVLVLNGDNDQTISRSGTEISAMTLRIDKPAGTRCFFDKPVNLGWELDIVSGIWQDTGNNFVHMIEGPVTVGLSGAIANDTNNTFTFVGNKLQSINYGGSSGGFTNIIINKSTTGRIMDLEATNAPGTINRYVDIPLYGDLILTSAGNLTVESGDLNSNGHDITCPGHFTINSSTAAAYIEAGSTVRMGIVRNLSVNAGLLSLAGSAAEPVTITSISGFYNFNVESGANISAINTIFEKMTANGVNIKTGALVNTTDPFKNCTFQNGSSSGTLLTLNSNQTLNIDNAVFPANTWSGSNNVKKTVNWGTVNFNMASGSFSGAAFESDTYNRINWLGGSPDLLITSIDWSSNSPYICDPITVTVNVQNNSTTNITTPFRVDLYKNRSTAPPAGLLGDSFVTISSLSAGATTTVTFTNISSATPVTWTSWFQVDANGLITETNESNNVWTPAITTTWNALPVALNLQAVRSGNNVSLSWTYPISVYRYKIYKDINPYGTFSTLAGTSSTPSFTQAISGTKWFYRVRAERNLP